MGLVPSLFLSHRGLGLLVLLALQFSAQPFLAKAYTPPGVSSISLVLAVDVFKFLFALLVLVLDGSAKTVFRSWTFRGFLDAAGLPSLTYLVQNYCIQMSYQRLDSVVFNVLNQSKMLFTAFFVYLLVGRGQSNIQCVALVMVAIAGALVSLGDQSGSSPAAGGLGSQVYYGVAALCLGSMLSGLGAGITERVLIGQKRNNYLLSAEMSFLGIVIASLGLLLGDITPGGGGAEAVVPAWREEGLFAKWRPLTVVPVLTQALGGILVGLVTTTTGSVKKGFAIISGLILTCALKSGLAGELPSGKSLVAVPLAAVSIFLHTRAAPPLPMAAPRMPHSD